MIRLSQLDAYERYNTYTALVRRYSTSIQQQNGIPGTLGSKDILNFFSSFD
jgi:hypothetical protein